MTREEQNRKDWIDHMVKELDTEKKLREDLEVYYNLIQVNSEVIEMLSRGLLTKPNYKFEVFKEFLDKNYVTNKRLLDVVNWLLDDKEQLKENKLPTWARFELEDIKENLEESLQN